MLVPTLLLSVYFISNEKDYGSPLPWNVSRLDPGLTQPRDDGRLDFVSFKPWESISAPIIVPGKMHSFWTLVYSGMWFDNEPKFLHFWTQIMTGGSINGVGSEGKRVILEIILPCPI